MLEKTNVYHSVDEIQQYILRCLFDRGDIVNTRGFKTLEICNINFCLDNPRSRITNNLKRKWSYPLAIGEFAWHISGSNDLDFITYYARQWKEFSIDGKMISQSCYGHKIFGKSDLRKSQWDKLIDLLKEDKYSRRAILNLYDPEFGLDYFAKDIACVSTVQFLVRKNKLDLIVTMRSNDIIWGLPYDIFFFSMLQELLSLELNVELGTYYHNVGSMHLYERHFTLGKEMLSVQNTISQEQPKMEHIEDLDLFINLEEVIRKSNISLEDVNSQPISQYWKDLLVKLWHFKNNRK